MSRKRYYFIYSCLFVIIATAVFSSFIINKKSFIWEPDGLMQHYTTLVYFGRWARKILRNLFINHKLVIPMWDLNIGYGSDILTTLHFYGFGNPFLLISIFVPSRYTDYLYGILALFYLYLSGITFSGFCFYKKKQYPAVLAGVFSYVFCGFALFTSVRHPFFILLMCYLPLLLLGAEYIFDNKSPAVFILMVFVSAISNFYLFYMLVIGVILYVVLRFLSVNHSRFWKELLSAAGKFALYGITGTLMAGIVLVPVISVLVNSARANSELSYHMLYDISYYKRFITDFMSHAVVGNWTILGFTGPAFVALLALFGKKGRKTLKAGFIILTLMLCLPVAGKIMNGFSYVSNRWCGIYAALISYILVCMWPELFALTKNQLKTVLYGSGIYFILLIILDEGVGENSFASFGVVMCTIAALLLQDKGEMFSKHIKRDISVALVGLVILNVCINGYYLNDFNEDDYVSEHVDLGEALSRMTHSDAGAVKKVNGASKDAARYEGSGDMRNDNTLTEVPGISFYWSLAKGEISQFQSEMLFHASTFKTSIDYYGNNRRTFLNALSGVSCLVARGEDTAFLPFGYKKAGTVEMDENIFSVYENKYTLPLCYTYSTYISRGAYDKIEPSGKQEALLQGALIEQEELVSDRFKEEVPDITGVSVDYSIKYDPQIVDQGNGTFLVTAPSKKITLEFDGKENSETYVYIKGLDSQARTKLELFLDDDQKNKPGSKLSRMSRIELNKIKDKDRKNNKWSSSNTKYDINISTDYSSVILKDKSRYHQWYEDEEDYLINLGYRKEGCKKVTIQFPRAGVYHFDELKVLCQPMDHYAGQAGRLKEVLPSRFDIGINRMDVDIDIDDDRLLFFSIPYDKGWTAYVDGKKEEVLQANTMYMALPLKAGGHTVVLKYETYGLKQGALVSAAGFGLWLVIILFGKRKMKRDKP